MIKFAIWGIGRRGKGLIQRCKDKIACIIESNSEYHNTYFEDIPIIGLEEYINSYSKHPVIITPKGFEHTIEQELRRKGICDTICYSKFLQYLIVFGIPVENMVKEYDYYKNIMIYGGTILGYLLFDYLSEKGYMCNLVLQSGYSGKVTIPNSLKKWKGKEIKESLILLTLPLEDKDMEALKQNQIKYEKCYETLFSRKYCYNPNVKHFKNIHQGKRCFIVATGPSLKIEDLNRLHQNKEICISVNGIFAAFDKTEWRPHYYMISDMRAAIKWKNEILEDEVMEKFIADRAWIFTDKEMKGNMYKWHIFREQIEGAIPQFSDDFAEGTYAGLTITYDGALQLAVYMGFTEIYLLGVDCNYKEGGYNNYFFEEKIKDTVNHQEETMILAYRAAELYAKSHRIKIYNATRGGMLEEFERIDFDSLFEEKP